MLVADDLADTDDGEVDGGHGCLSISMIIDAIFIRMPHVGKGSKSQMQESGPNRDAWKTGAGS
ncbi:hypothetical protein thsrh120_26770 [Rhizobium sp. No.120]